MVDLPCRHFQLPVGSLTATMPRIGAPQSSQAATCCCGMQCRSSSRGPGDQGEPSRVQGIIEESTKSSSITLLQRADLCSNANGNCWHTNKNLPALGPNGTRASRLGFALHLVDLGHGLHLLLCEFALALLCCLSCTLALKQSTTVCVKLQLGDDAFAGVHTNTDSGT